MLGAASVPYAMVTRARRWAHRNHFIPEDSLAKYKRSGSGHPIRVLSVGNITTGGTGKTPMTAWVVHRLKAMGLRPGVLLRGYKAVDGVSEEAALLAQLCGECPVVANPNRMAGAMEAMAHGAEVMVLDDGFQHLRLRRDLDIVLIDATNPFGYGRCLPRGLLREPLSALRDAEAIVITRSDAVPAGEVAALRERLADLAPKASLHLAVHAPTHFLDERGQKQPLAALAGRRVLALCGIGNPDAFFATLERLGVTPAERVAMEDHVDYTAAKVEAVREKASLGKAEVIVTTRKDGVKLAKAALGLPLWQLAVEMEVVEGEAALVEKIRHACSPHG